MKSKFYIGFNIPILAACTSLLPRQVRFDLDHSGALDMARL